MESKQEFIELYQKHITREGSNTLLEYLLSKSSDFFIAPASTRFHNSFDGGLVAHSIDVYKCLNEYLSRNFIKKYITDTISDETIAICALLHDVCKINSYKKSLRNVKDDNGVWQSVPYYEYDDKLPYGHGEKSVYIISGYMKLTRDEAFAIRYHMGFSGTEERNNIGKVLEQFPLALSLAIADMEATYIIEK